jgi:hypothetical protein
MFFKDKDFKAVDQEIEAALEERSKPSTQAPAPVTLAAPAKTTASPRPQAHFYAEASKTQQQPGIDQDVKLPLVSMTDALLVPRNKPLVRQVPAICALLASLMVFGAIWAIAGAAAAGQITPFVVYAAALVMTAMPSVDAERFRDGAASLVALPLQAVAFQGTINLAVVAGFLVVVAIDLTLDFGPWKRAR